MLKVELLGKIMSLRPRNHSANNYFQEIFCNDLCHRLMNKSLGFLTKILGMFNPVSRPIRGLIDRPH